MKVRYLDRWLIQGPYIGVCLDAAGFYAELKRLEVPKHEWPKIALKHSVDATTHILDHRAGRVFLVCVRLDRKKSLIAMHALLVHEAVHIFRNWCASIGEDRPSEEFECYAIQGIAQRLMEALK